MDKVRAVVNILWTQRFWVLSVICTIVGVVCWNMAASDLSKEFNSRKSKIDSAYRSVQNISSEQVHPNDDVNSGDTKQAQQQREFVLAVWQELYEQQRKEVLFWPESLGPQFVKHLERRKFGDKISSEMRDRYLNYIETRFDALLEIVKAKKIADGKASRGGSGDYSGEFVGEYVGGAFRGGQPGEAELDEDYLVQWLDQEKVQKKLLFKTIPKDLQVWVTQEDLWVYESLLGVFANTNKARGATRSDNTAVRAIVALEIGNEVTVNKTGGQVFIPQATEGAGGDPYTGGYSDSYSSGGGGGGVGMYSEERGGGGLGSSLGGGADDTALLANRYLDSEGNPDPGTSADSVGSAEFRQLPVRIVLKMDQRWIPRVLIECANAALPVEVKQLRINPDKSGAGFGQRQSGGRSNVLKNMAPDPNLADVEIRGVVYIYNEPDTQELAIPGDNENSLADNSL